MSEPVDDVVAAVVGALAGGGLGGALLTWLRLRRRDGVDLQQAQAELVAFIVKQNEECQRALAELRIDVDSRTRRSIAERDEMRSEIGVLKARLAQCEEHWRAR